MPKLMKRGTATSIADFYRPGITDTDRPYEFNCKNAPEIITNAIQSKQNITIIGDYDCDGVCATAILATALRELGAEPTLRLPLRFTEGYGMKASMVDEIESGLIITVDNGIAAHDAIRAARDKGLDIIITDHHLPTIKNGEIVLPDADCIINPHLEEAKQEGGYTFYDYCGAGVALKIAEKLLGKDHAILDRLYAFAAIATVADVMPLVEDNRNIYIRGAKAISNGNITKGLQQLFELNKINYRDIPDGIAPHFILSGDIMGYKIGPCINAASRMADDGASRALDCILSDDSSMTAIQRAADLIDINEDRKELTNSESSLINEYIKTHGVECPVIIHLPDSGPGIIGLHAGKICEDYKTPAIVINGHGDKCKGSCRAPLGVNMKQMLDEVSDCMVTYGGHAGAAGLTIREDKIDELRERLQQYCRDNGIEPDTDDTQYYDLEIDECDFAAISFELQQLAPFGEGNPEPVFAVHFTAKEQPKILGGKHLKLNGENACAIGFNMATNGETPSCIGEGQECLLVGTIGYNCFRGNVTPQLSIQLIPEDQCITHDTPER